MTYVLVIPQNEYGILVITETEGQARSSVNNKDTIRVNGVTCLSPTKLVRLY